MSEMVIFGAVDPWISNWLTPVWLVGVGALAGLLLVFLLWGLLAVVSLLPVVGNLGGTSAGGALASGAPSASQGRVFPLLRLFSRRTVAEFPLAVREGVLWPLFLIAVVLAGFGVVGTLLVREPVDLLASLARLPYVGTSTLEFDIPVSQPESEDAFAELTAHEMPVSIDQRELRLLTFYSDQNLSVASKPFLEVRPGASIDVIPGEGLTWIKGLQNVNPFMDADVTKLYVRNSGSQPAKLSLTITTAPPYAQVSTIPITAVIVLAVFLVYLVLYVAAPRLSAIALSTYKSEVAQPLFAILLAFGIIALVAYVFVPYNTFGEDIKMLKDQGMITIMLLGIFQAIWAAGSSIADEIEGKTAMTVLSKPIGRRSFIVGKFLGILWTVWLLFVVLGVVFMLATAYKPLYDAKESSTMDVTWQLCHLEMTNTIPGLALAFMETVVLTAISVAISTRLPFLANFVISLAIYLLGHLTPLIVQSSMGQFEFVQFFGRLIATVFPNLDHFNIQAAVSTGVPVPDVYLGWALVYCLIYSLIAMLLAWVLFEDRDLA